MGCSKQACNYKWKEKTDHMKNNDPLFSIHYEQEPSRAKSADKTDLQLQYENDP